MQPEFFGYAFGFIVAVVIALGGVYALLREKEIVDANGKITHIEIEGVGKFKTNYPSIAAIAIAALLAYFVSSGTKDLVATVPLDAKLAMNGAVDGKPVFVAAVPQRYHTSSNSIDSELNSTVKILVDPPTNYTVIAYTVRGVRANGETVYSVSHGPARSQIDKTGLIFEGRLYVD